MARDAIEKGFITLQVFAITSTCNCNACNTAQLIVRGVIVGRAPNFMDKLKTGRL